MKKKMILSVILTILLTFSSLGLVGSLIVRNMVQSEEYLLEQVEKTNTYGNAYDSLMKKFSDSYNSTSIPIEVYEKGFTKEWIREAVNAPIMKSFGAVFDEAVPDYSQIEKSLTEYFESYAHENHVMRDEMYEQKLKDSISDAISTAESVTDVYQLKTMQKAGIWNKIEILQNLIDKIVYGCLIASALFVIILIILRKPIYWIGTSAFASGIILAVPSAYVKLSNIIMNFSVKEYTTYTLVTGTMNSVVDIVLRTGVITAVVGFVMIGLNVFVFDKKAIEMNTSNISTV